MEEFRFMLFVAAFYSLMVCMGVCSWVLPDVAGDGRTVLQEVQSCQINCQLT